MLVDRRITLRSQGGLMTGCWDHEERPVPAEAQQNA
jgi:hypothetical protein